MNDATKLFHELHKPGNILILPNAWDAGSARIIENAGAKAIATTSAGVAWALGHPDGNKLDPAQLAAVVSNIVAAISVPLSVDVEGGYSDDAVQAAKNVKRIIEAGAIGINIEDGEGSPDLLARKIEQIRKVANKLGVNLFINARTDVYLNGDGAPESQIEQTIVRAKRYQEAGASGLFVPALSKRKAIKIIASEVKLPLNVMAVPNLPAAEELSKLGVRRLSAGGSIAQILWKQASEIATKFLVDGVSATVLKNRMTYSELQSLFE
jgi:2-methylisocitrate lyase-like PEP mutase family enzyme